MPDDTTLGNAAAGWSRQVRSAISLFIHKNPTAFALRQHVGALPALRMRPEQRAATSWSQHGEDEVLLRELGDQLHDGYYVDVGASHPIALSNTYRLYCNGMRGICIEPNRVQVNLHEAYRPGDIAVRAAVGPEDGLGLFHEMSYHTHSTFSAEAAEERIRVSGEQVVRRTYVPIFRLSTILRDCVPEGRRSFALLSVDVEGLDEAVLRSNDWERFRPRLVLAERNSEQEAAAIAAFMTSVGYAEKAVFGVNALFAEAR